MTVSSDVQVRVRAPETPASGANPGQGREESAYTRAIPRDRLRRQVRRAKSSASLHVVEARESVTSGWAATEQPPSLAQVWAEVLPGPGEAASRVAWTRMSAAGLFRALVITLLWTIALAVKNRLGAEIALYLLLLLLIVGVVARTLH